VQIHQERIGKSRKDNQRKKPQTLSVPGVAAALLIRLFSWLPIGSWRVPEDDLTYAIITLERGDSVIYFDSETPKHGGQTFSLTGLLKGHSLGLGDVVI
jgi:hypothetical protein